ncbi:MAG: PglZ domain-containing protein [Desulforegulaceae bacterium]|nr:PglZ domain-containing protein [Desulforegulaceae bacterium]
MNWAEYLFDFYIKDNVSDKKIILSDKAFICNNKEFLNFIKSKGFSFNVSASSKEFIKAVHSEVDIIICDYRNGKFSVSIANSFSFPVIEMNYNNLPFNIDAFLFESIDFNDLQILMNFSLHNPDIFIHEVNYKSILDSEIKKKNDENIKDYIKVFKGVIENSKNLTYDDILEIGIKWGDYIFTCYESGYTPDFTFLEKLDSIVLNFIITSGLKNIAFEPLKNFKSVERISGYLSKNFNTKTALLCFDGMGVAEWFLLKKYLNDFSFIEKPVFSMIPSVTRISRFAIYSGNIEEIYNSKSPNEEKAFKERFNNGVFLRNKNKITDDSILGFNFISKIYNIFDDTAHSTLVDSDNFSKNRYFKIIEEYLYGSGIKDEVKTLIKNGYKIFFCSDHGCTVSQGNGYRFEKYLIDSFSKRGTIIKTNSFLNKGNYFIYNPGNGLDIKIVLAPPLKMFANMDTFEITHGGVGIEEIVIPFIEVEEKV